MLIDKTDGKLDEAREFARGLKLKEEHQSLENRLEYLSTYAERAGRKTTCYLYPDFAPHSFEFVICEVDPITGNERRWFNGGLIYHGKHDNGGDGGMPTLSVCLNPVDGWSIHT